MNEYQLKDSFECEEIAELGKEKDCLGCSCSVCLVNYHDYLINKGQKILKEQLLETLKNCWKNDFSHEFCSLDEIYGATKTLTYVIQLIQNIK